MAAIEAYAKTAVEPVSRASHHTSAKLTAALPKSENACPVKMTANVRRHESYGRFKCVSESLLQISRVKWVILP